MTAHKIGEILAASGELKPLSRATRRRAELERLLFEAAPRTLSEATRVTGIRAGTLLVSADNAAVAAKLRQLVPRLLIHISERDPEVTGIRVDVQVKPSKIKAEDEVTKHSLPPEAIKDFVTLGESLPPSPLKSALARLVARRGPNKPD